MRDEGFDPFDPERTPKQLLMLMQLGETIDKALDDGMSGDEVRAIAECALLDHLWEQE